MPIPSLYRAISFLEGLREIEPEITAHTALVLLHVASKPGYFQRDLIKAVPLSQSAVGRQVDKLCDREGLGLITAREDYDDRRARILSLTSYGDDVVKGLLRRI